MKFFAAAAAGVALGCGSPAFAFVHGGGSIVGSSSSRLVRKCLRAFESEKQERGKQTLSCHFFCGPVCALSRLAVAPNVRRRG